MDLGGYEDAKFALAALLRTAESFAPPGQNPLRSRIAGLFSRLAEDRFNLVVVGRFSRGKTSLMNAVLGTDRLPTGIRPLTSVIATVTYGSREKAVIHYRNFGIPEEIPLSALPQYVTEQGNSANRRGVSIAEIQLPIELLRRGFHFIDTPGLGSPIVENTRTTERFLPEADAFILVTSYEGPLSEEEVNFLDGALGSGRRVFVVLNKQDIVSAAEREDVLRYLQERLHRFGNGANAPIFSMSARDGLEAKRAHDAARLAETGLADFEQALLRFLINEKSREVLLGMCGRIGQVLRDLPPRAEVAGLGEELGRLAKRIDASRVVSAPVLPASVAMPSAPAAAQIRPCEICVEVTQRNYDFLRKFQYDIIVSPEHQRQLAERSGLCSFHIWGYESVASPHGTCAGFAEVLDRLAARLSVSAVAKGGRVPRPVCPACETRAAAEAAAVRTIAGRLREDPERALAALSDLCLPHFRLLAAAIDNPGIAARLFARETALLRRVAEDMRRYALKHEGVRRYLASEEEEKAAQRALLLLAGHRMLNTPAEAS